MLTRARIWIVALASLAALAPARTAAAQDAAASSLRLEFHDDGTLTLVASNVTVRDILAEWARRCGCYVVNADRLTGGPFRVPIEFTRTAQRAVLESLLRQAAGYALTPRRPGSTGPSNFETIYIVASSQTSSSPSGPASYTPPAAVPLMTPGSPDDELPPVQPLVGLSREQPPAEAAPASPTAGTRPAGSGVSVAPIVVPIRPTGPATPAPATSGSPTPQPASRP